MQRKADVASLLIGQSAEIEKIREQIIQVAPYAVSVLLTGETGTGKELAATAIHAASPRNNAPFMKINCGALPSQLLESELFGHKKGAFSGADKEHIGLLRSANSGTVLLDEIGEMPIELQVKLLQVLQDHEIRPVGDVQSYPVDIRVIAATNKDMEKAVKNGSFRKDLYYRLATYHIHLPPLRERRDDIPSLAMFFFTNASKRFDVKASISHSQIANLCIHDYPGNVRELASLMEHAVISMGEEEINANIITNSGYSTMNLYERVESYERSIINSAVICNGGNMTKTAQALGIPRTSLIRKFQRNKSQGIQAKH
jgi:transcriptional regulator with PAS, ATPase and Fis domain